MHRVVHFELPAQDPDRAADFYHDVFEWRVNKWEGPEDYWLVMTGNDSEPGINGGIMHYREGMQRTIVTIDVESIEEYLEKIRKAGGSVVMEAMAIPGVGYQAYCTDTEGNVFGIHKQDPDAA